MSDLETQVLELYRRLTPDQQIAFADLVRQLSLGVPEEKPVAEATNDADKK